MSKKTSRKKPTKIPLLSACIKAVGPTENWKGNCYAVSCQIVDNGLVKGDAVYGHWLGPVDPKSYFAAHGLGAPFVRHGWILLEDGRILDPTRWVFEAVTPYLFIGPGDAKEYDEGGNKIRTLMRRPLPAYRPESKRYKITAEVLPSKPWTFVEKLLQIPPVQPEGTLTIDQLFWLGNLSPDELAPHTWAIYQMYEKIGRAVLIPIDNFRKAQREAK